MSSPITLILFAVLVLGPISPALADDSTACANPKFSEARSLTDLPPALARKLGADQTGVAGIADRGGEFPSTDNITKPIPMRRFSLAAVGEDCVLVALEQGGIGYSRQLRTYERKGTDWLEVRTQAIIPSIPNTLEELLALRK